jgi:fumarate reductase subunit C
MSETSRLYHRPISIFWWLERRSYLVFVLRELSCVFVAWFVVYFLLLVNAVSSGSAEYESFLDWSGRAWVLVLNVVALLFVLLHAVTWFNLAPKAMVIRAGGRRIPPPVIVAAHYLAWLVVSAVTAWVILR